MNSQLKTTIIGLFVASACAVIVGLILFIEPRVGDGRQVLHIMMSNVQNINPGTRVLLAGYPIGEVNSVTAMPNTETTPNDAQGNPYIFDVTIHVDSNSKIYNQYQFGTGTFGLLGEKVINIQPQPFQEKQTPTLLGPQDKIYGNSQDMIESALNQFSKVAVKAEKAIDAIHDWVEAHGQEIANAINHFGDAMHEFDITLKSINDQKIVDDLKKISTKFVAVSDHMETITEQVASGRGTLGSLIMQDQTYLQINSLLSRANTLVSDINNYGLLFQNNRQWQRMRSKRAALIDDLKTPNDYVQYFQSQVDTINSAIGRLHSSFESLQTTQDMNKTGYLKAFREFSVDVSALGDSVKLLNESLADSASEPFCPPCQKENSSCAQ